MSNLSLASLISLYILLGLLVFALFVLFWWQSQVFKGKTMDNPDGSSDDWHEQKILYGMAFADIFIACPLGFLSAILILLGSRWGFYLMALESFFFVWINTATTATSLKFQKPEITFNWSIVFPFGAILGFAFLVWTIVHFDLIYII